MNSREITTTNNVMLLKIHSVQYVRRMVSFDVGIIKLPLLIIVD